MVEPANVKFFSAVYVPKTAVRQDSCQEIVLWEKKEVEIKKKLLYEGIPPIPSAYVPKPCVFSLIDNS